MIRNLLVIGAAVLLALGAWDLYATAQLRNAYAMRPQDLPATRPDHPVRLFAEPAPAAVAYYDTGVRNQRMVAMAFEKPVPGKHVVVRLAFADAHGKAIGREPWRGGNISGILVPLPASFKPAANATPFPPSCPVSVVMLEYDPQLGFPLVMVIAGAIACILLLNTARGPQSMFDHPRVPPPAGERTPYHEVRRPLSKILLYGGTCAFGLALTLAVRTQRLGGPQVFENPLVAIAGCAIAIVMGWLLLERSGTHALICLGGVEVDPGGESSRFVRWQDVTSLRRLGSGYTLLMATELSTVRLELGSGAEAQRAASAIAAHLRAWLLPVLRERLMSGKVLEMGKVELGCDEDGTLELAGDTTNLAARFQELENGFLLPTLLSSSRTNSDLTLETTGDAAWIEKRDAATLAALKAHGTHMLDLSEKAAASDDPVTMSRYAQRALTFWETAGELETPEVGKALLVIGHALLGQGQAMLARHAFDRAAPLCVSDPIEHARAYHGLAVARWLDYDPAGALDIVRSAYDILDGVEQPPLYHLLIVLNTYAGLQLTEGHLVEAQELMELVLVKLENANPGDLPEGCENEVVSLIQNYSLLCAGLYDPKGMAAMHARATGALATLYGLKHALVGQALYSLGTSQLAAREPAAAVATLEAALGIARHTHGGNDAAIAACLDRLGEAYFHSGHEDKAHDAWQRAAALVEGAA